MDTAIFALAFLQNLWVKDPQRVRVLMERYGDGCRASIIRQLLFSGGLTGRRLRAAFGESLCHQITWEEASREIAGDSVTVCRPDLVHVQMTIDFYRPDVVLAFGSVAGVAVASLWTGRLICSPHPACRRADTLPRLREAAAELKRLCVSGGAPASSVSALVAAVIA